MWGLALSTDCSTDLAINCLARGREAVHSIFFDRSWKFTCLCLYIQLWICVIGDLNLLHVMMKPLHYLESSVLWDNCRVLLL
jgi:hypothetical protein